VQKLTHGDRIKSVRECLKKQKCTHLLVTEAADVEYISGFRSSNAAVVISENEKVLFSDFRYKSSAEQFLKRNSDWVFSLAKENLYTSIAQRFGKKSVVGFQSDILSVDALIKLKKHARFVKFKPLSDSISSLFISKMPSEISCIKTAAAIADKSFREFVDFVKPEMTELEAARKLEMICMQNGSEGPSFDTIIVSGPRSALPHGRPGNNKLSTGKFIIVDFGCKYKGFCSDMTRTFVFRNLTTKMKKVYTTVLDAQLSAYAQARAGIYSDHLDKVARDIIEKAGFGEYFGHALGHGVGLRIHEQPRVSPHTHVLLDLNSVVTIEPGIYIPGTGGVRIEDMVLLLKDKADILTTTSKELLIL
jgi:Xaa-Pro aminopeptidase